MRGTIGAVAGLFLMLVAAPAAVADDYDLLRRAPGWWETTVREVGSSDPGVTSQVCTDEAYDRLTWNAARAQCSTFTIGRAGAQTVIDSVCDVAGFTQKQRSVITGDPTKAIEITISAEPVGKVPAGMPKSLSAPSTVVQSLRLLGACPAGRKPGEAMMMGRVVDMKAMMERMMKKP